MQATVRLFTVLDTVHWEVSVRRHNGDWDMVCRGHVPDPDAPTEADVIAYTLGELAEQMNQAAWDARHRRG